MMFILVDFLTQRMKNGAPCNLCSTSTVTTHDLSNLVLPLLFHLLDSKYQIGDAANELHRVR